jgi:hypothetical protein
MRSNWLLSDSEISKLAAGYVEAGEKAATVRGSYLKALVAHVQAALKKKGPKPTDLALVETTSKRLYDVVLAAVSTPNSTPLERNSRSAFARSAKATLVLYVKAGGSIRELDPATVTKQALREASEGVQSVANTPQTKVNRSIKRLLSVVRGLPAARAISVLNAAVGTLTEALEALTSSIDTTGTTQVLSTDKVKGLLRKHRPSGAELTVVQ